MTLEELNYPKGFEKARALNEILKLSAVNLGLEDFGGKNYMVSMPETVNINGKDVTLYAVCFG